jgi:hypothetical protein
MPNNFYTRKNLLPNADWGKSRTAYWERESGIPRTRELKFEFIDENLSFTLPANVRIHGEIVVFNNNPDGGTAQAAITIGTSTGGTQISTGASVAANSTSILAATDSGVTRAARTIFIESTAWQPNTHLVIRATEYPPVPDTTALS